MQKESQPDRSAVGAIIAKLRKGRALTQSQLADRLGVSRSTIAEYERGRLHLNETTLIQLARLFGVSSDELLGLKKPGTTAASPIRLRFSRRIQEIEKLSESRQKHILRTLDDLIKASDS